jgi:hypothetical protein
MNTNTQALHMQELTKMVGLNCTVKSDAGVDSERGY